MEKLPKFMSINQVAKTGILPEKLLRSMAKRGELPAAIREYVSEEKNNG